MSKAEEFINNPQKRKEIIENVKGVYRDYIKPIVSGNNSELKASQIIEEAETSSDSQQLSTQTDSTKLKIVVSEEQAEVMLEATKKKAQELSMMLTMLSLIYIKDNKTDNEYKLEQEYLKQLTSDEMTTTMKLMVERKDLLDKETVILFTDFMNGYLHYDKELIPIKRISDNK